MMPQYLRDDNLSFKAKAILTLLIHEPSMSLQELSDLSSESKGSAVNGLRELIEKGYVIAEHKGGRGRAKREIFPNGPKQ